MREKSFQFKNITLDKKDSLFTNTNLKGNTFEIEAEIEIRTASRFGFEVRKGINQKTVIGYDVKQHKLFIDRSNSGENKFNNLFTGLQTAPLLDSSKNIKLHIFVDLSSVELFGDDGKIVMTDLIFPSASSSGIDFFTNDGKVIIKNLVVWNLKSIWH